MTDPPEHSLKTEFGKLTLDSSPEERLSAVYAAYQAETGKVISTGGPTGSETAEIREWLRDIQFTHPEALGWYKEPVLQPWVQADVAAKASWIQQAPCIQCHHRELGGESPYPTFFYIKTRPFTKQVPHTSAELTEATIKELERRNLGRHRDSWKGVAICATVVAIQDEAMKIIDVDNAAKAVIDTMKGLVFPDDRQIDHLSASRIRYPGDPAFYLIGLRPVESILADVVDPTCKVIFG